jgi:hypothetical protein
MGLGCSLPEEISWNKWSSFNITDKVAKLMLKQLLNLLHNKIKPEKGSINNRCKLRPNNSSHSKEEEDHPAQFQVEAHQNNKRCKTILQSKMS